MEQVILVNTKDEPIGSMEKMEAHHKGLLHRAFSVILFNNKGELLLQKRADHKYHSGGLWTNTCCSHQKPDEKYDESVTKRLFEEMGIKTDLYEIFKFIYKYEFHTSLIEHELDHVYIGETEDNPVLNPDEASDWKWVSWPYLLKDIKENEENYTFWFKEIIFKFCSTPSLLPPHLQPKSD